MNKYIKSDIEQGLKYLKIGIMNALSDIESGICDEINLEGPIALKLVIDCAEERGWKTDPDMNWDWTSDWPVVYTYTMITNTGKFVYIDGSVLENNIITLTVNYDDE